MRGHSVQTFAAVTAALACLALLTGFSAGAVRQPVALGARTDTSAGGWGAAAPIPAPWARQPLLRRSHAVRRVTAASADGSTRIRHSWPMRRTAPGGPRRRSRARTPGSPRCRAVRRDLRQEGGGEFHGGVRNADHRRLARSRRGHREHHSHHTRRGERKPGSGQVHLLTHEVILPMAHH